MCRIAPANSCSSVKICNLFYTAGIDVDIIANNLQNGNCAKLQNTLNGIAFCDPESEFPETSQMPPEMLKVFKIAQLTIQYLLHSQDMLTDGIKKLKSDNCATNHVSQN